MSVFDRITPTLAANARQARRLRAQSATIQRQHEVIETLRERLRRMNADVDLLGACIPPDKRAAALGLVRDRHRIEDLSEVDL